VTPKKSETLLSLRLGAATRERWNAAAAAAGLSVGEFVKLAVEERIEGSGRAVGQTAVSGSATRTGEPERARPEHARRIVDEEWLRRRAGKR
jgi:hypothetical protein